MGNIRVYKVNVFYGLEKESRSQTYWVTNEYNTPLAGSDILEYISEKTGMKKKERLSLQTGSLFPKGKCVPLLIGSLPL